MNKAKKIEWAEINEYESRINNDGDFAQTLELVVQDYPDEIFALRTNPKALGEFILVKIQDEIWEESRRWVSNNLEVL